MGREGGRANHENFKYTEYRNADNNTKKWWTVQRGRNWARKDLWKWMRRRKERRKSQRKFSTYNGETWSAAVFSQLGFRNLEKGCA